MLHEGALVLGRTVWMSCGFCLTVTIKISFTNYADLLRSFLPLPDETIVNLRILSRT